MRKFKCYECEHTWELPFGGGGPGVDQVCPRCSSRNIYRVPRFGGFGRRRGKRPIAGNEPLGRRGGGQGRGWLRRERN